MSASSPELKSTDASNSRQLRTNLHLSTADATTFNVMVGLGETYFPVFALALGKGERISGLIATVPMLAGALLQLLALRAVPKLGSYRRWVVLCATVQALSFIPLSIAAFQGSIPTFLLFLAAAVYWGAGQATVPVWNTWVEALIPSKIRAPYFACRTRLAQFGMLLGVIGGGLALHFGRESGVELSVFGVTLLLAGAARFASSRCLAAQTDVPFSKQPFVREVNPTTGKRAAVLTKSNKRLLSYVFLMQGAVYLSGPFFAAYMREHLHMSYFDFVVLIASAFAARIVVLSQLGSFAHRYGAQRLLWVGAIGIMPLPAMWLVSSNFYFLLALQIVGGMFWAAHELAMMLLFIDAIPRHSRMSVLSFYNLGNSAAMATGTIIGAEMLRIWGEIPSTYLTLFAASSVIRIAALGLLKRVPSAHAGAVVQPPFVIPRPHTTRPSSTRSTDRRELCVATEAAP